MFLIIDCQNIGDASKKLDYVWKNLFFDWYQTFFYPTEIVTFENIKKEDIQICNILTCY